MPTYDYKCKKCGKVIEVFHGMNEDRVEYCPHCGEKMERKVSGGTNTLYKCPGFSKYKGRNA